MAFSETEQEAIILNAIWSMIDGMVNFAMFLLPGDKTQDTNLLPQTSEALRLFHVLLGDFLSKLERKGRGDLPFNLPPAPSGTCPSNLTFLYYLRRIASDPKLGNAPQAIARPTEAFATWLEEDTYIEKVWLPSIGVEVDLTIKRITWLKICADIGKHSFARLEPNVAKIVRILAEHGKVIDEGMGYAVLPEWWEWFHTHLFGYHASTIAEFLNNIRWGIYEYLQTEFRRAYYPLPDHPMEGAYGFDVPGEVTSPIAQTMYWDLMNYVRSPPYFPRFTVTRFLKEQF